MSLWVDIEIVTGKQGLIIDKVSKMCLVRDHKRPLKQVIPLEVAAVLFYV